MAEYLNSLDLKFRNLKTFLLENAERVKDQALAMATKHQRPYVYLHSKIQKDEEARKLAQRDGITEGLVCIFSRVEPCRTFSFRFEEGRPFVQSARRVHLYFNSSWTGTPRVLIRNCRICSAADSITGPPHRVNTPPTSYSRITRLLANSIPSSSATACSALAPGRS